MKSGEFNTIVVDDTYTHPATTTTEETVLVVEAALGVASLSKIHLDLSALLVNATIRVYYKLDGTNYRLRYGVGPNGGTIAWTTSDGPWIAIAIDDIIDHDLKITIQSDGGGEAAPRDIPFSYNAAR